MGNSQSNEISEDYSKFIEEQKKIIETQQNQINHLTKLNGNNAGPGSIPQPEPESRPQPEPEAKSMTTREKIKYILKIFELNENYDETSLKKAFLKLALTYHPDKGGDPENFKKLNQAYKFLLKRLSEKDSKKLHHELKGENQTFFKDQMNNNRQNINLSKNFDNNRFNQIYEEHRIKNVYDDGYGEWIEENKFTSYKIEKKNIEKNNFHKIFQEEKSKKVSKDVVLYQEPLVDISFKGKDSLSILGNGKIDNFSGESNSGLQFTDYRDAYSNTHLIDESSVDISKRSKNMKDANYERENISYKISDEDLRKQKNIELMEERKEKERIKRLKNSDQQAFSTYEALHQRMMGR